MNRAWVIVALAVGLLGCSVSLSSPAYAHRIGLSSVRAYMKLTGTDAERYYRNSIRSSGVRILSRHVYLANCYRDPWKEWQGPIHVHEIGCAAGVVYELDPTAFSDVYYFEDEQRYPDRAVAMYFVGATFYCGDRSRVTQYRARNCRQMGYGLDESVAGSPFFSPKQYDSDYSIQDGFQFMKQVIRRDLN